MKILSFQLILVISIFCTPEVYSGSLNFTFKSQWCPQSKIDHSLTEFEALHNQQQYGLVSNESSQPNEIYQQQTTLAQIQRQFFMNLERTESSFYGIMGLCDYWVKRYTGGRLQIECDDQIVKVFQKADKTPQEELAEDESIKYSNLQDSEILVIYAKPKKEVIQEITQRFRTKNIILRQIYDSCSHTDNNSHSTINQGIGIHFQITRQLNQPQFNDDLIWMTLKPFQGQSTKEIINIKVKIISYYQWHLLISLKQKDTFPQQLDLLQNHPNYNQGTYQKVKYFIKKELSFNFNISKEEYALVNYKLIPLSVWSYDPVVLDKEIQKIRANSQSLGTYTDQLKQMYDNILRFQRTMESVSPAFRPSIVDGSQTHITITDNVNTTTLSNQSNSLHQLFRDDFKMKLNANLNFIQVFLYLNITSNTYQDKLLIALINLQNQGVSMQIHVSITSPRKNDMNKIQLIYQCLDVSSQSLTLLQQILVDYDSYSEACMEDTINQENKFEQSAKNAIKVCSALNVCTFPLMLINEQAIDQPQLFDLISEAKDSKEIESFLMDIILDRSQEALKVLVVQQENKIASLDFQDFHYTNRYSNFTNTFAYQCVNNYQFRQDVPFIKYKDNSKFRNSTKVLISVYTTQQDILKEMKEWVSQMNNSNAIEFHQITDITELLIKGYIPLGKSSYIFINGLYIPVIETQWQLEELIKKEFTKLTALTKRINLKQPAFAFLTEINFMNILNDNTNKIDEIDFIAQQLQNQTIKLTQGYSNNNNAPLIIRAKLILLSKASVIFLSYLNQSQKAFDLDICWFVSSQLKIMQHDFQYHHYRLLWNTDGQSSLLVDDLKFKYPQVVIELDQFKFNFGIDSISHRSSLLDMDKNQSASSIFGQLGTLVFDTEKLNKLDDTVQISFTLNQVWTLGQVMLTQSDLKLSKFFRESRDTFIIMDIQNVVDQRLSMAEYLYIGVTQPGRYYVLKSGSDQATKFDFDGSAYQLQSSSIDFNLNYAQEESSYDHFSNSMRHLTNYYEESSIYNTENQTSIQFYFVVSGPLFENLQLNQIYQIVKVYQGKKEINIFIVANMLVSQEFKKHLETMRRKLPYFNYELLNFAWPYQLIEPPKIFRNLVLYYKILFTDQIIPLRVRGKVLFKDADQCLTSDENDISELFNTPLNSKPFGLVVHGNEGLAADMAARQLVILNLASSNDFYCAALILTDLETLRANASNQGLRNYMNKMHDEGISIDHLHSYDQGLMNLANRDGNIISPLPAGWLWSEDFWKEGSKAHAKNIDLQSMQTRDQKLQIAFKICPGYRENYDELMKLLKQ